MKVLFVKKRYHPYGGAELYLKSLATLLAKEGEVHLLTTNWQEDSLFKVHTVRLPSYFPYSDFLFALRVKKFVKNFSDFVIFSFDRTFSQDIYRASEGCHLRWLEQRKKFLDPFWKALSLSYNPKHQMLKYLEKRCLEVSKIIITNSRMVKEDFDRFYGEKISQKCRVIYNGVNLEIFKPPSSEEEKKKLRNELNLKKDEIMLLFVGSGYLRKGLIFVLKALALLPKEFFLVVVGKEKRSSWFQRLTAKLGIKDRVFFKGGRKDVLSFYQTADIFVLPTVYDPFSNACLEALACGLPVITTSANGAGELIKNGENGFVVDLPVDPEELACNIEQASKKLPKMRVSALNTAKEFSIEKAIFKLKEVIKECEY